MRGDKHRVRGQTGKPSAEEVGPLCHQGNISTTALTPIEMILNWKSQMTNFDRWTFGGSSSKKMESWVWILYMICCYNKSLSFQQLSFAYMVVSKVWRKWQGNLHRLCEVIYKGWAEKASTVRWDWINKSSVIKLRLRLWKLAHNTLANWNLHHNWDEALSYFLWVSFWINSIPVFSFPLSHMQCFGRSLNQNMIWKWPPFMYYFLQICEQQLGNSTTFRPAPLSV